MIDTELLEELNLPEYAGLTAVQKVDSLNLPRPDYLVPQIIPKSIVLQIIGGAAFRIATLAEPKRTGWLEMLHNIQSLSEGLNPSEPGVEAMLTLAVSDGVLTQQERDHLDSFGKRYGSRAEKLWGVGVLISLNDVAKVL